MNNPNLKEKKKQCFMQFEHDFFLTFTRIAHWIKNPLRRTSEHNHACIIIHMNIFILH